jgi:hypothetical protein
MGLFGKKICMWEAQKDLNHAFADDLKEKTIQIGYLNRSVDLLIDDVKSLKVINNKFFEKIESLENKVKELSEPKPNIGKLALQKFNDDEIEKIKNNLKKDFGQKSIEKLIDTRKAGAGTDIGNENTKTKTTDAIISCLNFSGNSLHYKEIFDIIKNYKLSKPDVTLDTIRATLYYLVKAKKIKNGKKTGTFFIKQKKNA